MFELEKIGSYKVHDRIFAKKEDALQYQEKLQHRKDLLDIMKIKILKIRDWSMEILINDQYRILILEGEYSSETNTLYKQVDANGRYELKYLNVDNLPILHCPHGATYKSLLPELKSRLLNCKVEDLMDEIKKNYNMNNRKLQ